MAIDFRVSTEFFIHYKTKKLKKSLGADGIISLLTLWAYTAKERPDGLFSGMNAEDIEIVADWQGECGIFVSTLLDIAFLQEQEGTFFLHDWAIHNPWASASEDRSARSRFCRMAKVLPDEYNLFTEKGIHSISKADYEGLKDLRKKDEIVQRIINEFDESSTDRQAMVKERSSPAPTPVPVPVPTPIDIRENTKVFLSSATPIPPDKKKADLCPQQEILDLFKEVLPEQLQSNTWRPKQQTALKARWNEKKKEGKFADRQGGIAYFRRVFEYIRQSDFLMGKVQANGRKPFRRGLDWFVKAENFDKLIQGVYHE